MRTSDFGSEDAPHQASTNALELEHCTLPQTADGRDVFTVSLALHAGSFTVVQTDDPLQEQALASALTGLLAPRSGHVRFQGYDWQTLSNERANALRGRIGTVFGQDIWSPYRTVMDGMILPQLHHTRRTMADICAEATQLCLRLGLPGVPQDFPATVSAADRQVANFVRAFLGNPALIVIRNQITPLTTRLLHGITSIILERRERGAAILWFDNGRTFVESFILPVHQKIDLSDRTRYAETERS